LLKNISGKRHKITPVDQSLKELCLSIEDRPISVGLLDIELCEHGYRFFGTDLLPQSLENKKEPESIQVL
jgi:hypothetical protein